MELVTIGIPVYNAAPFLRDTIISVINQTYKQIEIIIINDGSTDNSMEIAASFSDNRILIINDGENRGLISRLNQLVNVAKGKYFARMDADDIMFTDRIEKQLSCFIGREDIDVVYSDAISINEFNNVNGYKETKPFTSSEDILRKKTPIHPTILGTLEWFKCNPYDSNFFLLEDFELYLRTIDNSTYFGIKEPLLFYRETSNYNSPKYLKSLPSMMKMYKRYSLSPLYIIRYLALTMLKFLYHFFLERSGLQNVAVRYRFTLLSVSDKKKYQAILQNSCQLE